MATFYSNVMTYRPNLTLDLEASENKTKKKANKTYETVFFNRISKYVISEMYLTNSILK